MKLIIFACLFLTIKAEEKKLSWSSVGSMAVPPAAHRCVVTYIYPGHFVTAASCLKNAVPELSFIEINSKYPSESKNVTKINVRNIIVHPNYIKTQKDDIAVVKTDFTLYNESKKLVGSNSHDYKIKGSVYGHLFDEKISEYYLISPPAYALTSDKCQLVSPSPFPSSVLCVFLKYQDALDQLSPGSPFLVDGNRIYGMLTGDAPKNSTYVPFLSVPYYSNWLEDVIYDSLGNAAKSVRLTDPRPNKKALYRPNDIY